MFSILRANKSVPSVAWRPALYYPAAPLTHFNFPLYFAIDIIVISVVRIIIINIISFTITIIDIEAELVSPDWSTIPT